MSTSPCSGSPFFCLCLDAPCCLNNYSSSIFRWQQVVVLVVNIQMTCFMYILILV
uniref:Uncharacterized protein n=1 Tax=Arundo donax TaxID=35708 RepID=A0A0A9AET1_ARUDO